ncbi:hypothetical protein ACYULU_07510 [Breznakiellaceae bacterium SP9]
MLILGLAAVPVFSQSIVNPNDPFYDDLQRWDTLGLVTNVSPLRPYPIPYVQALLKRVIDGSNAHAREQAQRHYDRLFGKIARVGVGLEGHTVTPHKDVDSTKKEVDVTIFSTGHLFNLPKLTNWSVDYEFIMLGSNKEPGEEILPKYLGYKYDTYKDNTAVGPGEAYIILNSTVSYGNENIWLSGGMNRSSWGDFLDNGVVFTPDVAHTGNVTFAVNRELWQYTLGYFMLSASTDDGDYPYPEKYMVLHSLGFAPFSWLEFVYYESAVYGGRFEPMYLIPFSGFMLSQQQVGYGDDNIQMGLQFKIKPFSGFAWTNNILIDDIEFGDVIKGDFDTKMRVAVQTGLTWVPSTPLVSSVSFDYTVATPYTYAHYDYSHSEISGETKRVNYQNYTHNARGIGARMEPNSDRGKLTAKFAPSDSFRFDTSITFIRHANVNESLPFEYVKKYLLDNSYYTDPNHDKTDINRTDGSVFDSPNAGIDEGGQFSISHEKLMFMKQHTKQYNVQAGLNFTWDLAKTSIGTISLTGGYLFEFIYNDGVDTNMYTPDSTITTGTSDADIKTIADEQLKKWRRQLHTTYNHYASIGVKISY